MKRTTIRLDDALMAAVKEAALRSGRTLTDYIADALRRSLNERTRQEAEPFELETFSAALQPGVDLDDSAALLDLMESDRYPTGTRGAS